MRNQTNKVLKQKIAGFAHDVILSLVLPAVTGLTKFQPAPTMRYSLTDNTWLLKVILTAIV